MKKYALWVASSVALSSRVVGSDSIDLSFDGSCDLLVQDVVLPVSPQPLTYAYLSEASYVDANWESDVWVLDKTDDNQHAIDKLEEANWVLVDFVKSDDSGYVGSVWANDDEKQVVLAHRGSANAKSWATDVRSIVRSKPSDFVNDAIAMLNRPAFLERRAEGFHASVTGHSLGGFLAQASVAHSHLRGGVFDRTYYPDMSAVVFDSPGAADFIDLHIRSRLESEKARLPTTFNIMNFCVSPTVVSTFGRHYGVIYQLITGEPREWVSVVMDHKLGEHIRPHLELAEKKGDHWTSTCSRVAQWPEIALPEGVLGTVSAGGEAVTKGVFWLVNAAWKKARGIVTGDSSTTIAESALGSSGNSVVNYFLGASHDTDKDRQYERLIKQSMIEKHRLYSDKDTRLRMGSEHLDRSVYRFMQSFELAHKMLASHTSDLGWGKYLQSVYGDHFRPDSLRLLLSESREEVLFTPASEGPTNVFDAVKELQLLLTERGVELFEVYLLGIGDEMSSRINGLEKALATIRDDLRKSKPNTYQAYVARAKINALVMFGEEDLEFAKEIFEKVKPGDTFEAMVAIAEEGSAAVLPKGMAKEDLDFAKHFLSQEGDAKPSTMGVFNDRQKKQQKREDIPSPK